MDEAESVIANPCALVKKTHEKDIDEMTRTDDGLAARVGSIGESEALVAHAFVVDKLDMRSIALINFQEAYKRWRINPMIKWDEGEERTEKKRTTVSFLQTPSISIRPSQQPQVPFFSSKI